MDNLGMEMAVPRETTSWKVQKVQNRVFSQMSLSDSVGTLYKVDPVDNLPSGGEDASGNDFHSRSPNRRFRIWTSSPGDRMRSNEIGWKVWNDHLDLLIKICRLFTVYERQFNVEESSMWEFNVNWYEPNAGPDCVGWVHFDRRIGFGKSRNEL